MHDIDRVYMEADTEGFEFSSEAEGEVFSEDQLHELAAELMAVSSEEELDHFLGGLIKKAAGAVGKFVKSPVGKQLGGMLKGLAKKALPVVGGALGNFIVPGAGGLVGSKLGSMASKLFELNLEGLSEEDQQFEISKQFVRLAADATKNAVSAPASANPVAAVRGAVSQAVQRHAPGLLGGSAGLGSATSGRWVRKGNRIILFGV